MHRWRILGAVSAAAAVALTAPAARVAAEPEADLAAAVNAERSASDCSALTLDPLAERVAQLASQNSYEYVTHQSPAVPFTDPMPALATVGHPADKAVLLSGYGPSQADAVHFVLLNYRASKLDCSYTSFGGTVLQDDTGRYFASVVLTAP